MNPAYPQDLEHGLELFDRPHTSSTQTPSERRSSFKHVLDVVFRHSRTDSREPILDNGEKNLSSGKGTASTPNPDSSPEDVFYPEGGWKAYSVVFGSFCGMVAGFGLLNTVGTFQAYLSMHQLAHYSESEVGWIIGLYTFFSFFCGVQTGPIFDAKGPRWLVFAGSVFLVVGVLGIANSTSKRSKGRKALNWGGAIVLITYEEYWHFVLTFSILSGVGTSLIFTPAISAVGHWFKKGRGGATGLAQTGGSIGGIIFPLMLQKLFVSVGFVWATRILALIILVLVIIANLLIRSRLPSKPGGSVWPDFRIFGNSAFALTTASTFFMEWALFVPIAYLSSYALRYGISNDFSYQLLAVLNAGSFFGRWVPGYLADRWGRFNLLVVCLTGCLVFVLAAWLPAQGNLGAIIVFAIAFGFSSGSNISLTPVCVGQLCDTENYGRWFATCYTIVSFACLTGIPIAGQILTIDGGNYWGLIAFTGASYAAAWCCAISARVLQAGWKIFAIY